MKVHEQLQNINPDSDTKGRVWRFHCPACKCSHRIMEFFPSGAEGWKFNGDFEKPTFSPSVLVTYGESAPADRPRICHSHVTNGEIIYCGDSTHDLAGKTVPLPDYPPKAQ